MKRGELWTAAANADHASEPRPVLIIQADRYHALDSVTFVGLTSDLSSASFRPVILASPANGLMGASRVMVDKIVTVPRQKIKSRVGWMSDEEMAEIDRALLVFLGLA